MDWTVYDLRKALERCDDDALIWVLHVGAAPELDSTFRVVNFHDDRIVGRATIIVDLLTGGDA